MQLINLATSLLVLTPVVSAAVLPRFVTLGDGNDLDPAAKNAVEGLQRRDPHPLIIDESAEMDKKANNALKGIKKTVESTNFLGNAANNAVKGTKFDLERQQSQHTQGCWERRGEEAVAEEIEEEVPEAEPGYLAVKESALVLGVSYSTVAGL
ncbi:hypothetical protein HYALB_00003615 [Hymenoscyphus albidus]|uniref:Uncharacterized protein n=1 Tax=Hymenoscyphus albidus TaxID=595503 RepID=A0A9N9M151_9HELO|nr:hypothetical protein HYALB_00003615 [Hymenoscyphus albidus]